MTSRSMIVVALVLAGLAGCGGEDEPPEATPNAPAEWADPRGDRAAGSRALVVEAAADGSPAFRQKALQAKAGRVTLELVNPSSTEHSLCVEAEGQGALGCTGTFRGDRGTLRLRLEPGRYTFFCSVPGHRAAGMSGALAAE